MEYFIINLPLLSRLMASLIFFFYWIFFLLSYYCFCDMNIDSSYCTIFYGWIYYFYEVRFDYGFVICFGGYYFFISGCGYVLFIYFGIYFCFYSYFDILYKGCYILTSIFYGRFLPLKLSGLSYYWFDAFYEFLILFIFFNISCFRFFCDYMYFLLFYRYIFKNYFYYYLWFYEKRSY